MSSSGRFGLTAGRDDPVRRRLRGQQVHVEAGDQRPLAAACLGRAFADPRAGADHGDGAAVETKRVL